MDLEDNEYESLLRQFQPRKPGLPPEMQSTARGHRRSIWTGVAAAVVLMVGLSAAVIHYFEWKIDTHAVLETVDGAVYRIVEGHSLAANSGMRIEEGDILRTDGGAGATLALADGSRVEMRSQSELHIDSSGDGVRIRLNRGGIIVSAARQGKRHLYVQTKDVTVSVAGTVFFVNAEEAGSRVAVIQGEVHVQQGAESKRLLPGQQVASNPLMESQPVSQEISWSRHAEVHLALLQQSTIPAATSAKRLEFETASIKPEPPVAYGSPAGSGAPHCRGVDSRIGSGSVVTPQGRCTGSHVSLLWLIAFAYGLEPSSSAPQRIIRNDSWIEDLWGNGFQIDAKAENPATVTSEQLRQMLQALLEERFKLKVRKETRDFPGYMLSVGKGGSRLQPASSEEPLTQTQKTTNAGVQVSLIGKGSMNDFVEQLEPYVVFDKTDLKGMFAFNFTFLIPANLLVSPPAAAGGGGTRGGGPAPGTSPRFAALQAALQDQLGLQFESAKVPTEFIVIEHAEKPSEN